MKKDHLLLTLATALVSSAMLTGAKAQTVLSGDHVVEGDLEVGTALQRGGVTITGGTGDAASPGLHVKGDGGVLFVGTSGTGAIPVEGAGTRMMWYPGKAAFRVGNLSESNSTRWRDVEIGFSSVAFGESEAYGAYATAMGEGDAFGDHSTAMSRGAASAKYSTAMSGGGTDGIYSTAMSKGFAFVESSTAMSHGLTEGFSSTAVSSGWTREGSDYSTAMSGGVTYGVYSTGMSLGWAHNYGATAMSGGSTFGVLSIAGGPVTSVAFRCAVFGSYNFASSETPDEWVETDPIFVVGNGEDEYSPSNALVILKNGNVEMMAKVKMPRQGDILMGEFGNAEP